MKINLHETWYFIFAREKITPKFVHTKFFPTRMSSYKITSCENLFPSSNIDNCLKIKINLLSLQEKVMKKPFLVLLVLIFWRDIWKIHTPTHKLVPNTNLIFSVTRKKIDTTTRLWVPYFSTDHPAIITNTLNHSPERVYPLYRQPPHL